MEKQNIISCFYDSPCGRLEVASFGDSLCMCDWVIEPRHSRLRRRIESFYGCRIAAGSSPVVDKTISQLEEYFRKDRKAFDVGITLVGTKFQKDVWNALLQIGYGQAPCYQDIADAIGKPDAVRAVALAIGANPISIIVPCHRVIGKNGTLTGYAGGLDAKRLLLETESLPLEGR